MLEADGLYDNLTAYQNLVFFSRLYDVGNSKKRIDEVLGLVKLADRAKDKVGTYSKGMRQRLALARAMVHQPDIFILDEPTAGVDPTGQIEVRQIVLDLAKQGKTVFLSSHNLDEVQRVCNRVALIDRGEIKLYGERDKLQREMGNGEVLIETSETLDEIILSELRGLPGVSLHEVKDNTLVLSLNDKQEVPDLVNYLVGKGARIEQVQRRKASLEEIYTSILQEAER